MVVSYFASHGKRTYELRLFCAWFGRYDRVIWPVKGSCVPTGTIGPSSSRGSGRKKRIEDWLILPAESAKAAHMT